MSRSEQIWCSTCSTWVVPNGQGTPKTHYPKHDPSRPLCPNGSD